MTDEEIKAIERLKSIDENTEEYDGNLFKTDFETVLNLIQKQKEEIEKKDKIIDEMALWLYEDDTSFGYGNLKEINTQEKIKQYFERKVEDK